MPVEKAGKAEAEELEEDTVCTVCMRTTNAEGMLLCDKCDKGWHMGCMRPPMTKIPKGDWLCPECCTHVSETSGSVVGSMPAEEDDSAPPSWVDRSATGTKRPSPTPTPVFEYQRPRRKRA